MNSIAATIGNAGRRDLFYLSPDSSMTQRIWDGTGWTVDWTRLGGVFRSAPAAVATMVKRPVVIETGHAGASAVPGADRHVPIPVPLVQRIDVFGLGSDYSLYHKALFGEPADNPGPWEDLGGVFSSAPAAIVLDGRIHVFGLGTDYSMYHRVWDGRTWSPGWDRLGGFFSSAPSVVSWGQGRLDLFARGADFTLRHRALENDAWLTDWQNLGGNLASPPVAVSWGPSRLDVFAIGHDDGGVVHKWWDGMIWNDWEHVAGSKDLAFTSMPAAAGCAVDRLDVVATGCDGKLYHISSVDDVWSKPQSLDGQIASTPTLLVPAVNELQLIAPGSDGNLKAIWEAQR